VSETSEVHAAGSAVRLSEGERRDVAPNHDSDAGSDQVDLRPTEFSVAFPELYRLAVRVAYRILGNRDESEEIAQEALARTFARWKQVSRMESVTGWVARVTVNLVNDKFRRDRRFADGATPDRASADPLVIERFDVRRALCTLSLRQREVVLLRYFADQSEQAIAATLGMSPGSVKTHASRGLATLRSQLDPKEES